MSNDDDNEKERAQAIVKILQLFKSMNRADRYIFLKKARDIAWQEMEEEKENTAT